MVVRIQWKTPALPSPRGERTSVGQEQLALLMAVLLAPSALLAFTMAFWSLAADLRWTGDFFLSNGLFSHWQVWLATAAVLLALSRLLDRYAQE